MMKHKKVMVLAGAGMEQFFRDGLSRAIRESSVRIETTSEGFRAGLAEHSPDVVVIDETGDYDVKAAIAEVKAARLGAASIVVMLELREARAASYLRAGAESFVLRINLDRVGDIIDHATVARQRLRNLTIRQLDILRRIAEGQKTHEIARDLDLSVKTVETHRSEIKKRLKIQEFAGLVRYAVRVGLVSVNGALEAQPAQVD